MVLKRKISSFDTVHGLNHIQKSYLIPYSIIHIGGLIQQPYIYQRYIECGFSHEKIAMIHVYSYASTAVFSVFAGFLLKKLGHAKFLSLLCLQLSFSSALKQFSSYFLIAVSSCIMSFSMPSIIMVLSDWWLRAESLLYDKEKSHFIFNENHSFLNMMLHIAITPISGFSSHKWGTLFIFRICPIIFLISILFVLVYLNKFQFNIARNSSKSDIKSIFKVLSSSKGSLIMTVLDISLMLSNFLWMRRIYGQFSKMNSKPSLSFISGSFGIAGLIGALFSESLSTLFSKELYLFFGLLIQGILISLSFLYADQKTLVFICDFFVFFLHHSLDPSLLILRKINYPDNLRGYLMSLTRIPVSIFSCIITWITRNSENNYPVLYSGISLIAASVFALILSFIKSSHKDDEDSLLESTTE